MKTQDKNDLTPTNEEMNENGQTKDLFAVIEEVVQDLLTEVAAISADKTKEAK